MRHFIVAIAFIASSIASQAVIAEETNLEEIKVTAHPLSEQGLAQSHQVLDGEALEEKVQGTLGETLAKEPGVSSASWGVAAGRPVIHGLSSARVKTTQDRIDTLDVSVSSADHATTVEPFIADSITVIKGPSTLLYGSAAIGGVVDVDTGRIPSAMPEEPFSGRVEARLADNADAKTAVVRLDGALSSNVAFHIDAFTRDADDYEIPGFAESAALRASEEEHDHEEEEHHEEDEHEEEEHHDDEEHEDEHGHEEEEEIRDILSGSQIESDGGAIGLSLISENGFLGFSLSTQESTYGLFSGHAHAHGDEHDDEHDEEEEHHDEHEEEHHDEEEHEDEHGHEEEEEGSPILDMKQTRFDVEGQVANVEGFFDAINVRFGMNNYEHKEIEGSGEIGTLFENDAWEGRIELSRTKAEGYKQIYGLQIQDREFSALGEEAFVRPVDSVATGIFWLAEQPLSFAQLEMGARFDRTIHRPSDADMVNRTFNTGSASLGLVTTTLDDLTLSSQLDYANRAPTIEELYSNGAHLATQTFEIGDVNLDEESVISLSVNADYKADKFDLSASIYYKDFSDFIYQANTGVEMDELPTLVYMQDDATYYGVDAIGRYHFGPVANGNLDLEFTFDTVTATLDVSGNDNLPRIPATRYGTGLSWKSDLWTVKFDYLYVDAQNDVADFELATDSYHDVSLYLKRDIELKDSELSVFIHGRNLTDEEQRNHVSFVKDLAPNPGRSLELGVRYKF